MKVYAVQVQEIYSNTYLVKANCLKEAELKIENYNIREGFALDEITDVIIKGKEATEEDKKYCEWFEDGNEEDDEDE